MTAPGFIPQPHELYVHQQQSRIRTGNLRENDIYIAFSPIRASAPEYPTLATTFPVKLELEEKLIEESYINPLAPVAMRMILLDQDFFPTEHTQPIVVRDGAWTTDNPVVIEGTTMPTERGYLIAGLPEDFIPDLN